MAFVGATPPSPEDCAPKDEKLLFGDLWAGWILFKQKQQDHYVLLAKGSANSAWKSLLTEIYQALKKANPNVFLMQTAYKRFDLAKCIVDKYWAQGSPLGAHTNTALLYRTSGKRRGIQPAVVVYYKLHYDVTFRSEIAAIFDPRQSSRALFNSINDEDSSFKTTCKIGHAIVSYPGVVCINCGRLLSVIYRQGARGSTCMMYHKHQDPQIAIAYSKKCEMCDITYSACRVDFGPRRKKKNRTPATSTNSSQSSTRLTSCSQSSTTCSTPYSSQTSMDDLVSQHQQYVQYNELQPQYQDIRTIFLDPRELEYFCMGRSRQVFIHRSIMESISHHQLDNKSISLEVWNKHYNTEWHAEYQELATQLAAVNSTMQTDSGYQSMLRHWYFYQLLCSISDVEYGRKIGYGADKLSDPSSTHKHIIVDDKLYRKALVMTQDDEAQIKNSPNNSADVAPDVHNQYYFPYFFRKYQDVLSNQATAELLQVPVRLNKHNDIILYKGWFTLYGDGGQKISRIRCSYPGILGKVDKLEDGALARNDVGADAFIDLHTNKTALLYSASRYYQCSLSQCKMSRDRKTINMKLCTKHTTKMGHKYGMSYEEINLFAVWYCLQGAVARLTKLDIFKSINAYYEDKFSRSELEVMDKKKSEKIQSLEASICELMRGHSELEIKFKSIISEALRTISRLSQQKDHNNNQHTSSRVRKQNQRASMPVNCANQAPPRKKRKLTAPKQRLSPSKPKRKNSLNDSESTPRRSQRKAAVRCNANLNELAQMEHNQQFDELMLQILGETEELETDLYATPVAVRDAITLGASNNEFVVQYKEKHGCRKPSNMAYADAFHTNGLNVLMNSAGIILRFREEVVRETPTGVLLDIADACTKNRAMYDFANRIEAVGYDMMCSLYRRFSTLFQEKRLSSEQIVFWYHMLPRMFIDIWHVAGHSDKLCSWESDSSIFHPQLKKFEHILHSIQQYAENNSSDDRVNDIVAEQFWSQMNSTNQMKSMSYEKFLFFLLLKKNYHNNARVDAIRAEGWTFFPLRYFTQLRDISRDARNAAELQMPSQQDLVRQRNTPLPRVQVLENMKEYIRQQLRENIE